MKGMYMMELNNQKDLLVINGTHNIRIQILYQEILQKKKLIDNKQRTLSSQFSMLHAIL